jgi:AcrR family transcriptional regulator
VPATKRLQDREEKRGEIVAAARRLFIEDGYEQTSMSALAKTAGVAGNTIYWYFADKDDVLIAVLDAVLSDASADYQDLAERSPEAQLLWVVKQLRQMHRLVATVHARVEQSPAVSAWHDAFHTMTEALLRATVDQATATKTRASIDAEVKIAVFAIEGMLTHELDETQQQAICQQLAMQWTQR